MINFGKGPTWLGWCSWLQNDEERSNRILDAVERNSVIEGLPLFSDETRRLLLEELQRVSSPLPRSASRMISTRQLTIKGTATTCSDEGMKQRMRRHAEIREGSVSRLTMLAHSRISIAFEVGRLFEVSLERGPLGGFTLAERRVSLPYRKDYDTYPGNSPLDWLSRFDVSSWTLLSADWDGCRAGGAVVAFRTDGVHMLEERSDLAVLGSGGVSRTNLSDWHGSYGGFRKMTFNT